MGESIHTLLLITRKAEINLQTDADLSSPDKTFYLTVSFYILQVPKIILRQCERQVFIEQAKPNRNPRTLFGLLLGGWGSLQSLTHSFLTLLLEGSPLLCPLLISTLQLLA